MYKCVFDSKYNDIPNIDFEIFEKIWKYNLQMERKAKKFKFQGMRKVKG